MEFVPGKFNQPECRLDDGRALSDLVDEQNALRAEAPAGNPEMDRLVRTIWRLRQADGCPWDREQTHGSITKNMVEEAYEAVDAIEANDVAHLCEELGDVLFAAVKAGRFLNVDPEDALNATCEKFIARFRRVEEACAARGAEMSSLPLDELTRLWNEAKHPTE